METEELKAKLQPYFKKLEIVNEQTKDRLVSELDCLSNLIIDCYLEEKK